MANEINCVIGKIISEQRKSMNLKQYELAQKAGLSLSYVSDLENGRYIPSLKTFFKIASIIKLESRLRTLMTEIQSQTPQEQEEYEQEPPIFKDVRLTCIDCDLFLENSRCENGHPATLTNDACDDYFPKQ